MGRMMAVQHHNKGRDIGFWSKPDRVDLLRKLWIDPAISPAQIAARLNCTRTAIYNKAATMKLPCRPKGGPGPSPKPQINPARPVLVRKATKTAKTVKPRPKPILAITAPVPLWERTGCAWPVNDGGPYLFCNAAKSDTGGDYCDHHNAIRVKMI